MKLIGFAATYSPLSKEIANKHNYFMNGVMKDVIAEVCCTDVCEVSKMRSIFAVADGSKSEGDGADAAFLCMDMMYDVFGADFQLAYEHYFNTANGIVQSRSFSDNGAKMVMDIGVLYIYRNWVKAFNFGNVSIFHKSKEGITEISGKVPKSIEVDKVVEIDGELVVKKYNTQNTPYIGHISDEFAVVPYISEQIQFSKDDSFVITTESVMNVLSKKEIFDILNDQDILQEEKASAVISRAVEKNPDEAYTVEIIEKKVQNSISKLKTGIITLTAILIIGIVSVFALPNVNYAIDGLVESITNYMQLNSNSEDNMVEPWIPESREEEKNQDESKEATAEPVQSQPKPILQSIFKKPVKKPAEVQQPVKQPTVNTEAEKAPEKVEEQAPAVQKPVDIPEVPDKQEDAEKAENIETETPTEVKNDSDKAEDPSIQKPSFNVNDLNW